MGDHDGRQQPLGNQRTVGAQLTPLHCLAVHIDDRHAEVRVLAGMAAPREMLAGGNHTAVAQAAAGLGGIVCHHRRIVRVGARVDLGVAGLAADVQHWGVHPVEADGAALAGRFQRGFVGQLLVTRGSQAHRLGEDVDPAEAEISAGAALLVEGEVQRDTQRPLAGRHLQVGQHGGVLACGAGGCRLLVLDAGLPLHIHHGLAALGVHIAAEGAHVAGQAQAAAVVFFNKIVDVGLGHNARKAQGQHSTNLLVQRHFFDKFFGKSIGIAHRISSLSALNGAGRDAVHKVAVAQQVDQQHRDDGDGGTCHHQVVFGGGGSAVLQLYDADGQRAQLRGGHRKDRGRDVVVPRHTELEQRHDRDDGLEQRQQHLPEQAERAATVDDGSLVQLLGQTCDELGDQEHVGALRTDRDEDDGPQRVLDADVDGQRVQRAQRDRPQRNEHRHEVEVLDEFAAREVAALNAERRQRGEQHRPQRGEEADEQAIEGILGKVCLFPDLDKVLELPGRGQQAFAAHKLQVRFQAAAQGIEHGVDNDKRHDRHDDVDDRIAQRT